MDPTEATTTEPRYRRDPEFCPHTGEKKTFRKGKDQCLDCGTILYASYEDYCEG